MEELTRDGAAEEIITEVEIDPRKIGRLEEDTVKGPMKIIRLEIQLSERGEVADL